MDHGLRTHSGQSAIEYTAALIVTVLLFGGALQLWVWLNQSLVYRQQAYDQTRSVATYDGDLGKLDYYDPGEAF